MKLYALSVSGTREINGKMYVVKSHIYGIFSTEELADEAATLCGFDERGYMEYSFGNGSEYLSCKIEEFELDRVKKI